MYAKIMAHKGEHMRAIVSFFVHFLKSISYFTSYHAVLLSIPIAKNVR